MPALKPNIKMVQEQLEMILASKDFTASNRLKNFLRFVVEETLQEREHQIKAYTIAVSVFGRNKNFNSLTDPVVRVEAGKLRNKLNNYYLKRSELGKDKIRIDIPKGTYVPTFKPLAQSIPPTTPSSLPEKLKPAIQPTSIAILPFFNIGNRQEIEHLLNGLAEELSMILTKFEDLTIISARGMHIDTEELDNPNSTLVKRLGVRFLLYGNAQIDNTLIRMRINLEDTLTRQILWAEKFEGHYTAKNLFAIIDTIVSQVASRVGDSFGCIKRTLYSEFPKEKRTGKLQAFEAILYYHHWAANLAQNRFIKAQHALEGAIKADPNYALAHGMLADIYATHYQWDINPRPEYLALSEQLANRALLLDPQCQYGLWSKAYNYFLRGDKQQFLYFARLAVSINPADTYLTATVGLKIAVIGEWEEGRAMIAKARSLNQFLPNWFHSADCLYHLLNNAPEQALIEAKQINSPEISGPILRTALYGSMGRHNEAKRELKNLLKLCPAFHDNYEKIIQHMFYYEPMVSLLKTGVTKAGL